MSGSRSKKDRMERGADWSDPKTAREAQERKKYRRSNIMYGVIAIVVVLGGETFGR